MREILVRTTTPAGGGRLNVTYWDSIHPVASQLTALKNFFEAIKPHFAGTCTYQVEGTGREMNEVTGTLTGIWTSPAPAVTTGAGGTSITPDAVQTLFRWNTGIIIGGRFVQGRTFVPGIISGSTSGGNVSVAALAALNTAATNFVGANIGFGIWHRPVGGSGGVLVPVVGGTTWSELAVLRRRRA